MFWSSDENEQALLRSPLTCLPRQSHLKNPEEAQSPFIRRLEGVRGLRTVFSKVRACPMETAAAEDSVDETVVEEGAGEEDDFRCFNICKLIHLCSSTVERFYWTFVRTMYDNLILPSLQKLFIQYAFKLLLPWHLKLGVEVFFIVNVLIQWRLISLKLKHSFKEHLTEHFF